MPRLNLPTLARRPELVTYIGGWLASLSWLAIVGWTVGETSFNLIIFGLTTLGFIVSFWLRGYVDTPQWPAIASGIVNPSIVVRTLFVLGALLPGLRGRPPFDALIPMVARGEEEWLIGTAFMWLMAIYSFGMTSDGMVAFTSVLGLSMMGLMASSNVNPEIGVGFLTFMLGNLMMLSSMTLAHHTNRGGRHPDRGSFARLLGDQFIVAGLTVSVAAILAIGLAVVLQRISPGLLVPRINLPERVARGGALSLGWASFRDQIELGVGEGVQSTAPVMEIRSPMPLLWRRRVYDRYSGRVWTASPGGSMSQLVDQPEIAVGDNIRWLEENEIRSREPVEQHISFLAGADLAAAPIVTQLRIPEYDQLGQLNIDKFRNVLASFERGQEVDVVSQVPMAKPAELRDSEWVDPATWRLWLTVPVTARDVIGPATQAVVGQRTNPYDAAVAIQNYLQEQFTYDLAVRVPEDADDAMEHFFRVERGACDPIATAMTLMARQAGIPARVAAGYLSGDTFGNDTYLVRLSHAHARSELYFVGYGWIPFNPAVPADENANAAVMTDAVGRVLRLDRNAWLVLGITLMGLWLLVYALREWRQAQPAFDTSPAGEVARLYHQAGRLLSRRQLGRRPSETAREHLQRLHGLEPDAPWLVALGKLTELFERARYRLAPVEADAVAESGAALGELQRELKRRKRRRRGSEG